MFLEEKYNVEKNKQDCTDFVLKVLPKYLELKDRKKLREEIIKIRLLAQMNDTAIPNFENENYIYRNIMYIELVVNDIKKIETYIEILHKLFKAPTILKISDNKQNHKYSLCIKRLSKVNKEEVVIENIVTTEGFSEIINEKLRKEYEDIVSKNKNKNNKFEYYFELLLKTQIYKMKKELGSNYIELINSKIFYDIQKMQYNLKKLNLFGEYIQEYEKAGSISEKVQIKEKMNKIVFIC